MKKMEEQSNPEVNGQKAQTDCAMKATEETCCTGQPPAPSLISDIIRKRVYAAIALGFVPLPLVDLAGLTAVQIELLRALCKAHGIPFREQWIKSSLSSLLGSGITVAAVPTLFSLLKTIPVIGMVAGATTVCTTGAVSTYAIGRVFDRHFRHGGTLNDFSGKKYKEYFSEKLEEGKEYVKKMRAGTSVKETAEPAEAPAQASV